MKTTSYHKKNIDQPTFDNLELCQLKKRLFIPYISFQYWFCQQYCVYVINMYTLTSFLQEFDEQLNVKGALNYTRFHFQ